MASDLRKKTQDAIDALCDSNEGCELAMLIDGETGLVLCKSSDAAVPQNKLEDMAANAQSERKSALVSAMIASSDNANLLSSVRMKNDAVTAVVTPAGENDDSLVCQFNAMPNRLALFDSARAVFDLTSEAEVA